MPAPFVWKERLVSTIGVAFIIVGLTLNVWFVAHFVSADGSLSFFIKSVVWSFDGIAVVVGSLILYYRKTFARQLNRKTGVALLFSIIIALLLLEFGSYVVLRYILRVPLEHDAVVSDVAPHVWIKSSGPMPYGMKKNFKQEYNLGEFHTTISLNNVGMREREDYHGEPVDIGFVGDSFTFGIGVNEGERWSDLLRTYFPDKKILSYGFLSGLTAPHYYIFMKENPQLIPKTLVMGFYPYNDTSLDMDDTNLILDESGELVAVELVIRHVLPSGAFGVRQKYETGPIWFVKRTLDEFYFGKLVWYAWTTMVDKATKRVSTHSFISVVYAKEGNTPIYSLDGKSMLNLAYIEKLKEYVTARGSHFIVFMIPFKWNVQEIPGYDEISRQWESLKENLRSREIEFIDPLPEFISYYKKINVFPYFEKDVHWNTTGHKLAAEILARYLKQSGL